MLTKEGKEVMGEKKNFFFFLVYCLATFLRDAFLSASHWTLMCNLCVLDRLNIPGILSQYPKTFKLAQKP